MRDSSDNEADMQLFSWLKQKSAPESIVSVFNNRLYGYKSTEALAEFRSWVFACADAIADNFAMVPIYLMEKTKDGTSEVEGDISDKVMSVLNKPNPSMTGRELRYVTIVQQLLEGNAFYLIVRNMSGSRPLELYPLNPASITIKTNDAGQVEAYEQKTAKGKIINHEPKDILHLKRPNQYGGLRGSGVVIASAMFIDTDNEAAEWNRAFYANAAQPDAFLSTDQSLNKEQLAQIKMSLEEYKGSKNAGKTMVLHGGMKAGRISMTNKEMDFIEQRKFDRDAILAMFRVPKSVLAISDDVNRAAAEATKYNFAENNIKPKLEQYCDQLTQLFLPLFGLDPSRYFFWYDDPSPENLEAKANMYKIAIDAGYLVRNEVREEEGYEPVEGGDVPYVSNTLVPLQVAAEAQPMSSDTGPVTPPPTTPEDPKQDPTPPADGSKSKGISDVKKKKLDEIATKRVAWINGYCGGKKAKGIAIYDDMKSHVLKRLEAKKSFSKSGAQEFDDVFDEEWGAILRTEIKPLAEKLLTDSVAKAAELAIDQFDISMSFDMKNPTVMGWIDQHALEDAKGIARTAREEIREIFIDGVNRGSTIDEMAEVISSFFDTTKAWKATRLVRTEVISGYNYGYLETVVQSGLNVGKTWSTMNDDRVDDECMLNQEAGIIKLASAFPTGHLAPPVHPNCILGGQEVFGSNILTKYVANYDGPAIFITTSKGTSLSVTPNHLVLTLRGWVSASQLKHGDKLIKTSVEFEQVVLAHPDIKSVKSLIEQISIPEGVIFPTMPNSPKDFHGDGVFCKDVDVVFSNRGLLNNGDAPASEKSGQLDLVSRGMAEQSLLRLSSFGEVGVAPLHTPDSIMGAFGNLLAVGGSHLGVDQVAALTLGSQFDISASQFPIDHSPADSIDFSKLVDTHPTFITFDEIIDINVRNFNGHVYDLSTQGQWYTCNSIVTHNCRCLLLTADWE